MLKKVFSVLLVSLQLFLGYLAYQNYKAAKEEAQTIKQEIIVKEEEQAQEPAQVQGATQDSARVQAGSPANPHKKSPQEAEPVDLTSEATVNGLTIGRTTASEAMARLGKPVAIHGGTVYLFNNLNLYFKDGILIGFAFPGISNNQSGEAGPQAVPFKTSSGMTVGAPLEKVLARFGSRPVPSSGKLSYRDTKNGYIMNITFQDKVVTGIEVGKLE